MNKCILAAFLIVSSLASLAQEDSRYAQPELPGDLMIDVGMTFIRNAPLEMPLQNFNSRSVGIYYAHTFKMSDRWVFMPGIGVTAEKLRFDNNLNYQLDSDNAIVFDTLRNRGDLRTNKLAVNYLDIPVELRFYPTKTVDGEGMFFGVGAIIGLRMESHTKIKYDFDDVRRTEKLRDTFGLNNFRFGVQARYGLRGLHVFYKYYFSELYRSEQAPGGVANPNIWTLGINISGF